MPRPRPPISKPGLVVGALMMLVGAALAWPAAYRLLHLERTSYAPHSVDVYAYSVDEAHRELTVVFQYDVAGEEVGRPGVDFQCLGVDRCDRLGGILPPLVVSDAEAGPLRQHLLELGRRGRCEVYYDPSDPLTSGRIYLSDDGSLLLREHLGVVLLCTPLITWSLLVLIAALWPGSNHRRRPPLERI